MHHNRRYSKWVRSACRLWHAAAGRATLRYVTDVCAPDDATDSECAAVCAVLRTVYTDAQTEAAAHDTHAS